MALTACLLSIAVTATTATAAYAAEGDVFDVAGITYKVISEGETPAVSVGVGTSAGAMTAVSGDVSIPQTVASNGIAYEVTEVSKYAFSAGSGKGSAITSVVLPASVTSIGDYAFCSCNDLENISFEGESRLGSIGSYSFSTCASLEAFSVPVSVEKIGMYSFANCYALASFTFEQLYADEPRLSLGEGFLRSSRDTQDALTHIELPKRIFGIPSASFQYQEALQEIRFAGDSITTIGSNAFMGCCSVRTLELPEPTYNTGANLGTHALYGLRDLETVIFKGNETYRTNQMPGNPNFSTGSFNLDAYATADSNYPNVKTIVYYGDHQVSLFPEANHYQRVTYFASQEAFDANEPLGDVFVRDDVALRDIAAKISQSDDKGAFVLEGAVPVVEGVDSWHFVDFTPSSLPIGYVKAIACPSSNLASSEVVLDSSSLVLADQAVAPSYRVLDAWGAELVRGLDYQVFIERVETEVIKGEEGEEDKEVEKVEVLPSPEVTAPGNYRLVAQALEGSGRTGSVSAAFDVVYYSCTWTRSSGDARYSTSNHMTDSAFAQGEVDTVILADASALAVGAAAGGLAGVRQAPIVTTEAESLSMEAKRTLTCYDPDSVILVGFDDASTVQSQVAATLNANVSISNAFVADTPGLIAYQIYARTKRSGYWRNTKVAYVAPASDVVAAALAGSYAYRLKCPVFLLDDGVSLPENSAKALANDGFESVVLLGLASEGQAAVKAQLTTAGFSGAIKAKAEQDACALSLLLSDEQIAAGLCVPDNVTIVPASDGRSLVTAVTTCGKNAAPLVIVKDEMTDAKALLAWLNSHKFAILQGYVFGTREFLTAAFQGEVERVWLPQSVTDLHWATITFDQNEFEYDGKVHAPTVTVTNSEGEVLVEDTDYTLSYCEDVIDKPIFATKIVDAGSYTVFASGMGNYSGQIGAAFRICSYDMANARITLSKTNYLYNGEACTPDVTVVLNGKALSKDKDFRVAYEENVNAGEARVTVEGMGRYTGKKSLVFTISIYDLAESIDATVVVENATYTGSELKPNVSVSVGDRVLSEGIDYLLDIPLAIDAGTYDIAISGMGSYTGNLIASFQVNKASQKIKLSPTKKTLKASKLKKKKITFSIKAKAKTKVSYSIKNKKSKKCLSVTKKGKVSVKKRTRKGAYKITVKAAASENYKSASKTFTVKVR